jgi:hypothetical protein
MRVGDLTSKHCEHLSAKHDWSPKFWCGIFGCEFVCCDDCYDRHLLVHMFETPEVFRIGGMYQAATVKRAWHAMQICWGRMEVHHGHTPPPRTTRAGERK